MLTLFTITGYIVAWSSLLLTTAQRLPLSMAVKVTLPVAIILHGYLGISSLFNEGTLQLGVFQVASVLFVAMNVIVGLSALRLPLSSLFVILLPLSVVAIIFSRVIQSGAALSQGLGATIILHILLSIVSYSLLTIATLQAILLNYQNSQLKSHQAKSVIGILPPLQTMEGLLFNLVWAGFILLTASIATGLIFLEDMLEQKLSHKFLFSILSWILYALLLYGRQIKGWRGQSAIRWVIAGFVMLMFAYFGSKFVLEFILISDTY